MRVVLSVVLSSDKVRKSDDEEATRRTLNKKSVMSEKELFCRMQMSFYSIIVVVVAMKFVISLYGS